MSIPYDPPHYNSNFIFNEFDYNTDIITSKNETMDVSQLVQKSGDIMTGVLSIPSLNLYDTNGSLEFADDATIDTTVFVHKLGNSMVGSLNVPSLNLYDLNKHNFTIKQLKDK